MTQQRIYDYFERNPQLHVLFLFDKGFHEKQHRKIKSGG